MRGQAGKEPSGRVVGLGDEEEVLLLQEEERHLPPA